MKQQHLFLIPFAILTLAGCSHDEISGSGSLASEERVVNEFNSVRSQIEADIFLLQDIVQNVRIETHDNLLAVVKTTVENGELVISSDYNIRKAKRMRIYIAAPNFENINITGSGNLESENCMTLNSLSLHISGSGNIDFCGTAEDLSVTISGAGRINAYGLSAKKVESRISGSGSIKVTAVEELDANISGSGDVYYKGRPELRSKVTGSGRVIHTN